MSMMELASNRGAEPKRWKRIGFVFVALVFILADFFILQGATEAIEPWVPSDCGGCSGETFLPDAYRWLAASHGALLAILFGGSLIALLRRPFEKPMLLYFYAAGHLAFLVVFAVTAPKMALEKVFIFVMFLLILTILYTFFHNRASAIRLGPSGGYNRPLLGLTAAAALVLLPVVVQAAIQQVAETEEQFRWGEHAAMLITLLFGGVLASSRRPGALALALIVSLVYVYLGASALAVPDHPGSWGVAGGIASFVFGAVYAGVAIYSKRSR
ncbi:hypothetical protein SAMN02799630_04770 [Paenibacillus sp. UNCCL117]|uniref:hypothetical protein n=1 Tax=unclassified Paenibacillus TaxID=185978 RepID=UPI0008868B7C|nr:MULTISPECIES: hypothetical protein [unclassified Paenibacillus]SDE12412.1 hypothetical protein SAMN04488602_11976 [Paenibacillus sp. cl123]SFW60174.1 hypothetical protein SAMN02799630_04770 [Paenibacillus sp. UNCCL117]